jgi:hypothetical protein
MSEQQDYMDQMEHYNLTKQAGIEAYAEALSEMIPNVDPDKRILMVEGIKAALGGPPPLRFPEPPISHIFEETLEDGSITVWDFICLASRGTHSTKRPNGDVELFKAEEHLITLQGAVAERFWNWKSDVIKRGYPLVMARPL